MKMNRLYPTRQQADKIFETVIQKRNATRYPFKPEWEAEFRKHCHAVAAIAEKIAAFCPDLDPEKAYVLGLLHDCGRCIDEFAEHRFHANVGFEWMKTLGYDDVARVCITHSFYDKDFDINTFTQPRKDLLQCQAYLKNVTYNDYDLLLQLADVLNDKGTTCTIEYRFASLARRYNNPNLLIHVKHLCRIKSYFEQICGRDIYNLIGVSLDESQISGSGHGRETLACGNS